MPLTPKDEIHFRLDALEKQSEKQIKFNEETIKRLELGAIEIAVLRTKMVFVCTVASLIAAVIGNLITKLATH